MTKSLRQETILFKEKANLSFVRVEASYLGFYKLIKLVVIEHLKVLMQNQQEVDVDFLCNVWVYNLYLNILWLFGLTYLAFLEEGVVRYRALTFF